MLSMDMEFRRDGMMKIGIGILNDLRMTDVGETPKIQ
jgi:hypothetical protein